ncbi:MAG: TlyA family RNA methyltransferase [Deltaproteobacteria bacterium]|jgi:23S rRNA (cytidine1920-2'-O)/16S rRNA (cytidine1409-2'-O)-methyltransferase|nr:TlyA family RNA methyltransferase [Deltaproteobacteria bacterium]
MSKRRRADALLFEQGLAASLDMAVRLIMGGRVFMLLPGQKAGRLVRVDKPGELLPEEAVLSLKDKEPFVSRGGRKLLTALEYFKLDVRGAIALDAGASTGGFTDCLLQRGAARVYAVDVGQNLLHEKLKQDSRVVGMEGINLRLAGADLLPEQVDLAVADVSFISIQAVMPVCLQFLNPGGFFVALIKPQFEVEADQTVKGVVRDQKLREKAVRKVLDFARTLPCLNPLGVVPSAVAGRKGNQEYLAAWVKTAPGAFYA